MSTLQYIMQKSEDNVQESVLTFHCVGSRVRTQVMSLSGKCLYSLNHLVSLLVISLNPWYSWISWGFSWYYRYCTLIYFMFRCWDRTQDLLCATPMLSHRVTPELQMHCFPSPVTKACTTEFFSFIARIFLWSFHVWNCCTPVKAQSSCWVFQEKKIELEPLGSSWNIQTRKKNACSPHPPGSGIDNEERTSELAYGWMVQH